MEAKDVGLRVKKKGTMALATTDTTFITLLPLDNNLYKNSNNTLSLIALAGRCPLLCEHNDDCYPFNTCLSLSKPLS